MRAQVCAFCAVRTMGLCGICSGLRQISLKFLPDGSRPTYLCTSSSPSSSSAMRYEMGLLDDWTENSRRESPMLHTCPSTEQKLTPNQEGEAKASSGI